MKYKKKPVIIAALQLKQDEQSIMQVLKFMGQKVELKSNQDHERFSDCCHSIRDNGLKIHTLEGVMTADINDFIICGVNGEFYPCKPDIFDKTYEKVED